VVDNEGNPFENDLYWGLKVCTGELIREAQSRYVADNARQDLGVAVEALRAEASRTRAGRLSIREIDAEIAAARRGRRRDVVRTK
jgi:hypothetical protein